MDDAARAWIDPENAPQVPWVVYWFEFVITSIALVMLYWLWLRQFKHALLTLYGIVNAVATLQMSMYIAWKRRWLLDRSALVS